MDTNNTADTELYMDYLNDYQEAGAAPERLVPGRYYAELPKTIKSSLRTDNSGRAGIEFDLGQLRIVADEDGEAINGLVNRFYKVGTLPRGAQKFSDAVDLVKMFGIDPANLTTREAWDAAMESIAGQRTPTPIRFDYSGNYKHPISGTRVYKKSKDFRLDDGEYARVGFVIDNVFTLTPEFPSTIGANDFKAQTAYAKANGWVPVYANFEVGFRGWAEKA